MIFVTAGRMYPRSPEWHSRPRLADGHRRYGAPSERQQERAACGSRRRRYWTVTLQMRCARPIAWPEPWGVVTLTRRATSGCIRQSAKRAMAAQIMATSTSGKRSEVICGSVRSRYSGRLESIRASRRVVPKTVSPRWYRYWCREEPMPPSAPMTSAQRLCRRHEPRESEADQDKDRVQGVRARWRDGVRLGPMRQTSISSAIPI